MLTYAAAAASLDAAAAAGSDAQVPKGALVTLFAVAQPRKSVGLGRGRKSSEEPAFLPAGLPCFVT